MYNKNVRYESDYYLIERNPMTIIVGTKFDEGIVIGSDSQLTFGDSLIKRTGSEKIFEINLSEKLKFIVAGAGNPFYINMAKDIIINLCVQRDCNSIEQFIFICEDAANTMSKRYVIDKSVDLGIMEKSKISGIGLAEWLGEINRVLDYSLLIGLCISNEDGINHALVSLGSDGSAINHEHYAATGHGWIFAEYIFSRLWSDELKDLGAIDIILYVIEEVKKMDTTCGGNSGISILKGDKIVPKDKEFIRTLEEQSQVLQKIDGALTIVWKDMLKNPYKPNTQNEEKKDNKQ